jgi:predicted ribosome quality control (RQC) complex YloA/Tae2 family protein
VELSGIELRYLVNEISTRVGSGYYVSSVNAVTKDSLLFKLHHPTQEDVMFVLSVRGIWITKLKLKTMEESSLEKIMQDEIERARFESIEQAGIERIVSMKFKQPDGRIRIVIAEFFGNGNLIVCDESMQILAILNPIEVRHRTLKVGLRYAFPPTRGIDVFQLTLEQLYLMQKEAKGLDVLRWIGRSVSMPKKFVEEVAKRASIPAKQTADLTGDEVRRIYETIQSLVTDISSGKNHEPVVVIDSDGKPQDAFPIMTEEARKLTTKRVESYMDALDEVLSNEILSEGRSTRTVEIDRQIAVLEHDLAEQNKAKDAVLQKAAKIRKLADELMKLSYSGPDENKFRDVLAENSAETAVEKGIKYVEVAGERIELQSNLARLASMLFARAKELERGNASIEEASARLLGEIEKLRSQTAAIHKKMAVQKQTAKEWFERYRWFITTDGLLAIGGRDASSNSALIRKYLTENDIVFHAEVHGSPFFIVKNAASAAKEGNIDQSLQQVAQATVSFSRAWKDGLSSADAYWVLPDQVKKGAPTGQFLPKGSFVIEGKRNYIKGIEVRLAIGIAQLNGRDVLICGPADAIKKRSLVYAVLLQGGLDPMNVAKKVKAELVAAADETTAESVKNMILDDFVRSLPNGQSKISFTAKGEPQYGSGVQQLETGSKGN